MLPILAGPSQVLDKQELHLVVGQMTACTALCFAVSLNPVCSLNVSGCGLGIQHCCHSVITLLALMAAQTRRKDNAPAAPKQGILAPSHHKVFVCYSKQIHLHSKFYYFFFRPEERLVCFCKLPCVISVFSLQPNRASLLSLSNTAAAKLLVLWVLAQLRSIALLGHSVIIHVVYTYFVWLKPLHHAGLIITLKLDVFTLLEIGKNLHM